MTQNQEHKKIAPASEVARVYLRYVRRSWALLLLVIVFGVVIQASDLALPLFLREFFNTLALGAPRATAVHALIITLGLIAVMWLVDWAGRRAQDVANIFFTARIMQKLYADAFEYLMGHSYNFFISNFAGTLTHRVGRFARSYEIISDNILLQFFPTFLFIVGAITVLFLHNHVLGLILLAWSVAFVWFQIFIGKLRQPSRQARAEADTKVTGTLADAIGNQSTIAQFSGTSFELGRFTDAVSLWRRATLRSWFVDSATWGGIGLFVILIQASLLYGAIIYWQRGLLTLGDFVLIQAYLFSVFNMLMGISYQLRRFYDAFADAGEMVYVLNLPHEVLDAPGAQELHISTGAIEFRSVNFFFNETRAVLKDFNLTIKSHEKIALVGPSGAGKSTITKLLLRLYDIDDGTIEIDGHNIAQVKQESLRSAIAFVPQEPILFHRTLMENIRYGRRDATNEEVLEAAKQAHCHEFISQLPLKYETFVGERGIKLSGGERQRVAIARAILKNAPILVLDEATSSLDSESEALIQDALETLMRGKTVMVIAHRLSTIMKMDRIVVIEGGKAVAEGTHAQLLEQGGLYQKLWSIQAGGFIGLSNEANIGDIGESESLGVGESPDEKEVFDEAASEEEGELIS